MKKQDFEKWLRYKLYDLPTEDPERILRYYSDAIADRMEDGMTEKQAIGALGTQEEILTACRAGIAAPAAKKPSRKGLRMALTAAAAVLLVAIPALPRIFSTPQSLNPPTSSNTKNANGGIYVQSGDDRVNIIWEGIRVQTDVEPVILDFTTDHLHTLSIHEDVGNITAEPSPDDKIHITLPVAANYEQTTTDDGILKIIRTDDCGNIQLLDIAPSSLELQCDVGDISGSLAGRQSDYDIHASVDVGSCNLPTAQQTDGIPLTVRVDVGSIDLTFEEGNLT